MISLALRNVRPGLKPRASSDPRRTRGKTMAVVSQKHRGRCFEAGFAKRLPPWILGAAESPAIHRRAEGLRGNFVRPGWMI
jgi:hypothetical protein